MSSAQQSNPSPVRDPSIRFTTHSASLALPPAWRIPALHIGEALFGIALEVFGLCGEASSSQEVVGLQLVALGADLRLASQQLAALGGEPSASEMGDRERELCQLCEALAPQVAEVSRALLDAGRGIAPDGGPATSEA